MKRTESNAEALRLTIANTIADIPRMSRWLDSVLRDHQLPDETVFKMDLCANEAVTNIIFYAFPDGGVRQIQLLLDVNQGQVQLQIEDDGIPFNPVSAPPHVKPSSLEEATIGGLGIDLIRHYMDRCEYERVGDRNRLRLTSQVAQLSAG